MNQYSLDSDPRRIVIAVTGTITIIIFVFVQLYLLPKLASILPSYLPAAALYAIVSISFLSIFSLLYEFVNSYFWKSIIGRMFFRIPDFSGVWRGTLERIDHVTQKQEGSVPVELEVRQTFTQISIVLTNDDPSSSSGRTSSEATAVRINGNSNRCSIEHVFKMPDGWGACELVYRRSGKDRILEGYYVSSRPRKGFIRVTRTRKR